MVIGTGDLLGLQGLTVAGGVPSVAFIRIPSIGAPAVYPPLVWTPMNSIPATFLAAAPQPPVVFARRLIAGGQTVYTLPDYSGVRM